MSMCPFEAARESHFFFALIMSITCKIIHPPDRLQMFLAMRLHRHSYQSSWWSNNTPVNVDMQGGGACIGRWQWKEVDM